MADTEDMVDRILEEHYRILLNEYALKLDKEIMELGSTE